MQVDSPLWVHGLCKQDQVILVHGHCMQDQVISPRLMNGLLYAGPSHMLLCGVGTLVRRGPR
jgi:hypothetical protein